MELPTWCDLRIGQIEAAIEGRQPLTLWLPLCGRGGWRVQRLHSRRLKAIARAKESGYLVHTGPLSPWPSFNAWWLLCAVTGQPMVRACARGVDRSVVELDVSPTGGALDDAAMGEMYELVRGHSVGVVTWGPWGVWATGVTTGEVEAIAGELYALACDQ